MQTSAQSSAKQHKNTSTHSKAAHEDAISLLRADHRKVDHLFKEFEKENEKEQPDANAKKALVTEICQELLVHTQIEEEIFYPEVRQYLRNTDILDEAEVEHAGAKELVMQLKDASPEEALYDAKVTVLSEYIKHHVKEEQDDLFPRVRRLKDVNLALLGKKLATRKEELLHKNLT